MMRTLPAALAASSLMLAVALPVHAQTPDRQQPVNIDADKVAVDDRNKIHTFEGNVVLTQGSMTLKGDKIVITQDAAGFFSGTATATAGKLVTFRQKRANNGAWIDGEAERIEYNSKSERLKLFNRAQIQSAGDLVRGPYIEYDAATENYLVTNPAGQNSTSTSTGERPHITFQPKSNTPSATPSEAPR